MILPRVFIMNMNINNVMEIIGEDFNPFNWSAAHRLELEAGLAVDAIKTLVHVILQAEREGEDFVDLINTCSKQDVEFICAIYNLEGYTIEDIAADIDTICKMVDYEDIEILGADFNPFGWNAAQRFSLAVSGLVRTLKAMVHIAIQAEAEGVNIKEEFDKSELHTLLKIEY